MLQTCDGHLSHPLIIFNNKNGLAAELAFVIAAIVSLALVISYVWRVAGRRFALREAGVSQFLYLVLFSYAFFFEGYTGLVITIGAIITLAADSLKGLVIMLLGLGAISIGGQLGQGARSGRRS